MKLKYRWEKWQVEYLIDNYEEYTNEEIAKFIEKTEEAVEAKMYAMGLKREAVYLHKIRNTQKSAIELRKVFKEWDRLFKLPEKMEIPKSLSHLSTG